MTPHLKFLLIEDEPRVVRFITQGLEEKGHSVVSAGDGEAGLILADSLGFSVFILDIGLPGRLDGFDVAQRLRSKHRNVPIMMLTARDATEDVIRGLDSGADDYVTKPFDFLEFEARLRAMARRTDPGEAGVIRFGSLELDPLRGSVLCDGIPLTLTRIEFGLLKSLIENADRTVTRAELLEWVWGLDFDPGTRLIDVHMVNLRRKVEDVGGCRLVTERGVGFRAVEGMS